MILVLLIGKIADLFSFPRQEIVNQIANILHAIFDLGGFADFSGYPAPGTVTGKTLMFLGSYLMLNEAHMKEAATGLLRRFPMEFSVRSREILAPPFQTARSKHTRVTPVLPSEIRAARNTMSVICGEFPSPLPGRIVFLGTVIGDVIPG
jgi:hypothetical protein